MELGLCKWAYGVGKKKVGKGGTGVIWRGTDNGGKSKNTACQKAGHVAAVCLC
jgi:hypothetical protein